MTDNNREEQDWTEEQRTELMRERQRSYRYAKDFVRSGELKAMLESERVKAEKVAAEEIQKNISHAGASQKGKELWGDGNQYDFSHSWALNCIGKTDSAMDELDKVLVR